VSASQPFGIWIIAPGRLLKPQAAGLSVDALAVGEPDKPPRARARALPPGRRHGTGPLGRAPSVEGGPWRWEGIHHPASAFM